MDHIQNATKHVKGKHFSYGDRRELHGMLSNKSVHYSLRELARYFNCAHNTIRNELKRSAHHNGSEITDLTKLENNTTIKVYFAHT